MALTEQQQLETVMPHLATNGEKLQFTSAGDEALKKGTEIYNLVSRRNNYIFPPSPYDIETKIGRDRMILWFGTFYKRILDDPRMAVLFDTNHKESNVSAAEHGKRLALAILSQWTADQSYFHEVGDLHKRLMSGHQRAKNCPMRSKKLRGHGFTTAQRDSWLGHLWYAGEECEIPLKDQIVQHLAAVIGLYGPFVKDDNKA